MVSLMYSQWVGCCYKLGEGGSLFRNIARNLLLKCLGLLCQKRINRVNDE